MYLYPPAETSEKPPSQRFLLEIIDSISEPIFVKNRQHRWVFVNRAYCQFTGYAPEELIGKSDYDFFSTEQADIFWQKDELIFTSGVGSDDEGYFTDIRGEVYLISTKKTLFNDESGNQFLIGKIQKITASEKASEDICKFQQLSANVPGMLYQLQMHPDGSISFPYVSSGSYELLGIVPETIQAESSSLISMIHPDDYKNFQQWLNVSAKSLVKFDWEGRFLHPNTSEHQWLKAVSRPQKQLDNSIIWHGFLIDITYFKQAEKSLKIAYQEQESLVLERTKELTQLNKALKTEIEERKNTEAKIQKLAANVPGMLYEFQLHPDGSMSFPYVSSGCYEIYGLQPEEIQADANLLTSMNHPSDLKAFETSANLSAKSLKSWQYEGRIVLTSGENKWIKSNSRPEKLENGTILWYGIILDVTKRKQSEKALLRSNAMLQAQQEAAIDGILVVDENQNILSCNQRFVELWQIPESVISSGDEKQFLASMVDKFTNLGEFIDEVENLSNDVEKSVRDEIDLGDGRTFERYCAPISSLMGEYYGRIWYFRDITARKVSEQSLLRTNTILQAQQEASIDGILVVDEYRESISYNQRLIELWQIPQSVIETGKHEQIFALILDKLENPEEFISTLEYLFEHPHESCRNEIHLKDGKTFERYIASVCSFTGDNYGKIFYFRDISERKQVEAKLRQQTKELEKALLQLQRTQVQLIQSEKMSSLGQLVAGIAHEINNPVNFISANLVYTQEYFTELLELITLYQNSYPDIQIAAYIEEIEFDYLREDLPNILNSMKTGAERIQQIVLSLRTFSRLDEAELKKIDIHENIESTLMILQSNLEPKTHRSAIEIIKEYGNLPLVECYAGKLNQVFMNILNNAIDAIEEAIKTQQITEDESPKIQISTQLLGDNMIQISIIDNGSGIPEEHLSKLFDPFFTTKPVGKGTGLGLSMSYQIIVEQHEGKLNCISTLGESTEFQIQIPIKCK